MPEYMLNAPIEISECRRLILMGLAEAMVERYLHKGEREAVIDVTIQLYRELVRSEKYLIASTIGSRV